MRGHVYYIKFNWKVKPNAESFYKMTTYIFESMNKEGIFLYSEYGNLNGVHIYLSDNESYPKLVTVVTKENIQFVKAVIDNHSDDETPLHRIFLDGKQKKYECKFVLLKEIKPAKDPLAYLTKIQYYILRRGHLIYMTSMGKIEKKFRIEFNFLADCKSKNEIVKKLLDIVSQDQKGPWILY